MKQNQSSLPTLLFDEGCRFCRHWVKKWNRITRDQVRYEPYQDAISQYTQVTAEQCIHTVQLIMPDGAVFAGAHAIFKALELGGRYSYLLRLYESSPLCARLTEWLYQLVARHRILFSKFA